MTTKSARKLQPRFETFKKYSSFDQLDGSHPWMTVAGNNYVSYPVVQLNKGKVSYFNFNLAKEMGLVAPNHPTQMNPDLEQRLTATFALQIVNEYDQKNKTFPPETWSEKKYMATRYLQMQHPSRNGSTSGDGRGIWNGVIEHQGQTWDVSSRGTGVTCLAPGFVKAKKLLQTGSEEFGYGCGLAEIDELLAAAIQSEIFHNQHLSTERVLCVIDIGNGVGIGVRAGLNLFRPAHLISLSRQQKRKELSEALSFTSLRQVKNAEWPTESQLPIEDLFLKNVTESFAKFVARLRTDYIFTWMEWDGDNVLLNGGIIDYGSIRQFGLCHSEYRYDDVERYSTNLNEQLNKAKGVVLSMAQLAHYSKTKKQIPLKSKKIKMVAKQFSERYAHHRKMLLFEKCGWSENQVLALRGTPLANQFVRLWTSLEETKTRNKTKKVTDGLNRAAILDLRKIILALHENISELGLWGESLSAVEVFRRALAKKANPRDLRPTYSTLKKIEKIQKVYRQALRFALTLSPQNELNLIIARAKTFNSDRRMTGNALIHIVDAILNEKTDVEARQEAIDYCITQFSPHPAPRIKPTLRAVPQNALFDKIESVIKKFAQDI